MWDLTDQGRNEAREAGRILEAEGFKFDIAFTSVLHGPYAPFGSCSMKWI